MAGLPTLLSWTARRMAGSPATWFAAAVLAGIWGFVLLLGPVGLTTGSRDFSHHIYELAFLSALVGSSLAFLPVQEGQWLLECASPLRRPFLRLAMLTFGSTLGLSLGTLLPALAFTPQTVLAWQFLSASALCIGHLGVLAMWLSKAPVPPVLRSLSLPLLAWILPAVLDDAGAYGRVLGGLLNASRHMQSDVVPSALAVETSLGSLGRSALTIIALGVGAVLLEAHPSRSKAYRQVDADSGTHAAT